MSDSTPEQISRPSSEGAVPAWLVFGVVLLVEYLAISYAVDARDLLGPAGLLPMLGQIGAFAPLPFIFVAAVFVTGGSTVRARLRRLSAYRQQRSRSLVYAVFHLLAAIGMVALAFKVRDHDHLALPAVRSWLALWFAMVIATLVTLVLALWNLDTLFDALRGLRREFGLGLLIAVLAWAAGLLAQALWEPLAWLTLELVHALLTQIASDPVASIEQALVGTSRFYVTVAPVCSGVEGIGLMLTFVGAYLYIQRSELKWPRSFWLLPLATLLVWLLNVVRVTALIAVGTWYSPAVALGGFHSKAGWVFFTLIALGTVFFVQRSNSLHSGGANGSANLVEADANGKPASDSAGATPAYLVPLLVVLAAKLLTGLVTSGFDYGYPLSVLVALAALWRFRAHYLPIQFGSPWVPLGIGLAVAVVWIAGFQHGTSPSILPEALGELPSIVALAWLVSRVVGAVVTVPIVEELAFRGYLLRRFVSPDFDAVAYRNLSWLGLIVSSVVFGLLHSQRVLGVVAGLVFGLVAVARGRLSDAVVAHATANGAIVVYVLLSRDWALLG